jgi:thymidylate synthase (FAD)
MNDGSLRRKGPSSAKDRNIRSRAGRKIQPAAEALKTGILPNRSDKSDETIGAATIELIAVTPDAEKVIETAGRTAYQSRDRSSDLPVVEAGMGKEIRIFSAETCPSVKSVRPGDSFIHQGEKWKVRKAWKNSSERFIRNLILQGHISVLEHAFATFRIAGVSRAFTHQIVRHRMASFTQQSQRFVNEETFRFIEPPSIRSNPEGHELFVDFMERARDVYYRLQESGIRREDARFALPGAVESEIVVSANLREWRHILGIRGEAKAQWEIRMAAGTILKLLKSKVPSAFFDMEWDEEKGIIDRR